MRRLPGLVAGLVAAGVLAVPVVTAPPAGAAAPSRAVTCSATSSVDRRVLVVGDSLTVGADQIGGLSAKLVANGFDVVGVDAKVGRSTPTGLQRLRARRELPPYVVVALGTNDVAAQRSATRFARLVDDVVAVTGPDRTVVWVNVSLARTPSEQQRTAAYNRVLRNRARTTPGFVLVDWERVMRANARFVAQDRVHLTSRGYRQRADTLTAALTDAAARRERRAGGTGCS